MKKIVGAVISVMIGGSVYAVSQSDIIHNFSANTGLSQQQAEEYVKSIGEDDLAPFDEIGKSFIDDGNDILKIAEQIDCVNYTYPWETTTLTCQEGKSEYYTVGSDEISLGKAYVKLTEDNANKTDVSVAIQLIDKVNADFDFPIIVDLSDASVITEFKNTNSYNKSVLQATLK